MENRGHLTEQEDSVLAYVRLYYNVPAHVGQRVEYNGDVGTIIGGVGQYLHVKMDEGDREPFILHPTWKIVYLDA